jgi:hypothetical protein
LIKTVYTYFLISINKVLDFTLDSANIFRQNDLEIFFMFFKYIFLFFKKFFIILGISKLSNQQDLEVFSVKSIGNEK